MDYKESYDYFHNHFGKVMDYCSKNGIVYSIEPAPEVQEGFVIKFTNKNRKEVHSRLIPEWILTNEHALRCNDAIIRSLKINLK